MPTSRAVAFYCMPFNLLSLSRLLHSFVCGFRRSLDCFSENCMPNSLGHNVLTLGFGCDASTMPFYKYLHSGRNKSTHLEVNERTSPGGMHHHAMPACPCAVTFATTLLRARRETAMATHESEELKVSPAQNDDEENLSPFPQGLAAASEDEDGPRRLPNSFTTMQMPETHIGRGGASGSTEPSSPPPALPGATDCPPEPSPQVHSSSSTPDATSMGATHSNYSEGVANDDDVVVVGDALGGHHSSARRTVAGGEYDRRARSTRSSVAFSGDAAAKERGRRRRFSDLARATQQQQQQQQPHYHSHCGSAPPPWLLALRPNPAAVASTTKSRSHVLHPMMLASPPQAAVGGPGTPGDSLGTRTSPPSTSRELDIETTEGTWNEAEDGSSSRSQGKDRSMMGLSYEDNPEGSDDEFCHQVSLAPGAYRITPGFDPVPTASSALPNEEVGGVATAADRASSDSQAVGEGRQNRPALASSPLPPSFTRRYPHPLRRRPSDGPDAFLAEANLVVEEPAPALVEAKIIRRKRQICLVVVAILGGTGLLLGLILGLVSSPVLSRSQNGAPTDAPTSFPTASPTSELDHEFRSVLPDRTLLALDNATSPQHRAYVWATTEDQIPMLYHPNNDTARLEHMRRRFALATFYFATGGDATWRSSAQGSATSTNATASTGNHWLDARLGECMWTGCLCDVGSASPRSIDLQAHSLVGPIPPEVGLLGDSLMELTLSQNALTGTIPTEIGALSKLQALDLEANLLGLDIPTEIGSMASLEVLKLNSNGLVGSIPTELGQLKVLQTLVLSENLLRSSLPTEICLLNSSLEVLELSSNAFTGGIPSCFGSLSVLSDLLMSKNQLLGPIPSYFGNLSSLSTLDLSNNVLTGPIVTQLGQLTNLVDLELHWNRFSRTLPAELGRLTRLKYLSAEDNALTGPLPSELGRLVHLKELLLQGKDADSFQQLESRIPTELGLMSSLEVLDLSANVISGPIPVELANLTSLRELRLSNNRLNGTIPTVVGQLSKLEILHLAVAKLPDDSTLSGSIPTEIGSLTNLVELDLRLGNFAQSSIPSEIGKLSNLVSLLMSNSELSGSVPTEFGRLTNLQVLDLFGNFLDGKIPTELGRLVSLEELYLGFNRFNGTVPTELGLLTGLRKMNVGVGNQGLIGSIPAELCQVKIKNGWDLALDCDVLTCACGCDCTNRDDMYY
jgi:Leucine-rich repeat (LRR) protein